MASQPIPRLWTIEEYLAYELETGIKHEYLDGHIYAMTGGTDNHNAITVNSTTELGLQLRGSSCKIRPSDTRIQLSVSKYVYPDFSVFCGQAVFADAKRTMLTNPILVAEVLSPSTSGYDMGVKSELYRRLPSLQAYLLIDQNRVYLQLYTRHETGWLLQEFNQLDMVISLDAIQCKLPLSEIYRDIDFETSD